MALNNKRINTFNSLFNEYKDCGDFDMILDLTYQKINLTNRELAIWLLSNFDEDFLSYEDVLKLVKKYTK